MAITPGQCRAARALLDWSQIDLSKAAGAGQTTIAKFERSARKPRASTVHAIRAALESVGVVFIDGDDTIGPGVQLRDPLGR